MNLTKSSIFLVCAAALLVQPVPGFADVIYEWSGECVSRVVEHEFEPDEAIPCTGQFTAQLTLTDGYTPGTAFDLTDVLQLQYTDDFISVTRDADDFSAASGTLPVVAGATATSFNWNSGRFDTDVGEWRFSQEITFDPLEGYVAEGDINQWRRVPEPAMLWLMGMTILSLGMLRKHRVA